MATREFLVAIGLFCIAGNALSAPSSIFRCSGPGGSVTYQEIACPPSERGGAVDIPTSFPEMNQVERDRLLQREALLDARLLRRLEIEAAERIARYDRMSREREAEAQRALTPVVPAYVIVRPMRMHRASPRHRPL